MVISTLENTENTKNVLETNIDSVSVTENTTNNTTDNMIDEDSGIPLEYNIEEEYNNIPKELSEEEIAELSKLCDHVNKWLFSRKRKHLFLLKVSICIKWLVEELSKNYKIEDLDEEYRNLIIRFKKYAVNIKK